RRRHTRFSRDWSSDVCSSDLAAQAAVPAQPAPATGLRGKADAAASATLAALLPHLSRNDGMLLDRSANFAGDMNRLINGAEARQIGRASCRERGYRKGWAGS